MESICDLDALVLAVAHEEFKNLTMQQLGAMYASGKKILVDVKGLLDRKEYEEAGYEYWRL